MIRIVLLCQYGASTGMLTQKIRMAAKERELDVSVNAYSYSDVGTVIDNADIILLGPQIRFKKDEFEQKYGDRNVPFVVINTADYGRMNGEGVIKTVLDVLNK